MLEKDRVYLNEDKLFRRVNLLGGAYATVDIPSLVGYCHHKEHKGFITISIMNEHNCIAKECHYFEKFEDYPFWQKFRRREQLKELTKIKRKRQKENKKRYLADVNKKEENLIEQANQIVSELSLDNIKIVSIHKNKNNAGYTIFYISDKAVNDWYDFREIAFLMNKIFNKKFMLKHIKMQDGSYAIM